MVIVDVATKAVVFVAATDFNDKVERKEEAGPTSTEPATEEWSNKLKNKLAFIWWV